MAGLFDAEQVMTCKSTSVSDICNGSETSRRLCDSHLTSITEEHLQTTAAESPLHDALPMYGADTRPVKRVC